MCQDPLDRRPPVHFRQRVTEDRRHEKDVSHAYGVEAIGEKLGTGQMRHRRLHDGPRLGID